MTHGMHRPGSAADRLLARLLSGDVDWLGADEPRLSLPRRPGPANAIATQRNGWKWVVDLVIERPGEPPRTAAVGSDFRVTTCADAPRLRACVLAWGDVEVLPYDPNGPVVGASGAR